MAAILAGPRREGVAKPLARHAIYTDLPFAALAGHRQASRHGMTVHVSGIANIFRGATFLTGFYRLLPGRR